MMERPRELCCGCGLILTERYWGSRDPVPCPACHRVHPLSGPGGAPPSLERDFTLGTGWQREECLGRGRLGESWLWRTPDRHQRVVMKWLPASTPGHRQLWQHYLGEWAAFSHPGIMPVLGRGETPGGVYGLMPYREEESLELRLRHRGPLSGHEILHLLARTVPVLGIALAQGVLHGGLKPANLFWDGEGPVILSDFGLGRAWRGQVAQWERSPFPCDAPESRQAGILDRRTDIFSLGATAYELLTGQAWPAGGSWPRWVKLRMRESPLLRGLLARMTAPDPRDRYWDYQGLARDLERLLECYRPPSPPLFPGLSTGDNDRQVTPRKRSRWSRRLAGGGVDLVVLLGVQMILRFLFYTTDRVEVLSALGWLAVPSWLALALPRGRTLGQRVAGLRLIGRKGRHPSWGRRGMRALLLTPLFLSPLLLLLAPEPWSVPAGIALGLLAGIDLLATCGGRKGDALHDRWSGTRPILERARPALFSYREAWLAALLSAVLPGLGQWYNGQYLRGLLVLLTCWMILPYLWGIVDAWWSAQDLIHLSRGKYSVNG